MASVKIDVHNFFNIVYINAKYIFDIIIYKFDIITYNILEFYCSNIRNVVDYKIIIDYIKLTQMHIVY